MIVAIWIFTVVGLVLWSLTAWALHSLLHLAPGWAGDVKPWLDEIPWADWMEGWLPGWRGLAEALIDLAQSMFALVGSALGELGPWLVWGAWALGALLMLSFAGLLHLIVRSANKPSTALQH